MNVVQPPMSKSNLRRAARLGVLLNPPAFHPFNPILALRLSSLALEARVQHALIDALLAGNDPLDAGAWSRWQASSARPSAVRKRVRPDGGAA